MELDPLIGSKRHIEQYILSRTALRMKIAGLFRWGPKRLFRPSESRGPAPQGTLEAPLSPQKNASSPPLGLLDKEQMVVVVVITSCGWWVGPTHSVSSAYGPYTPPLAPPCQAGVFLPCLCPYQDRE